MSKLNVLIVGASIAGPTAAYWFAQAGAKVTVIERYAQFRRGGQAVDIRTAGVTIMRRMPGMEVAVRAKTTTLEGISFVDGDGRPYGVLKATGNPDQQSLVSEYEIFRGDLAEIIHGMTKDNKDVQYVFGEQVASIQQNEREADGPVTVEFSNGFPTTEYDLVVACDGATSRTRAIGLGCGVRDHIESINTWAAYFTIKRDLLEGTKIGLAISAVGGRFVAIGPDPTGVTRATLMAIQPRDGKDATLPFRQAMKQGDEELKAFVAKHFRGSGWRTDEILEGMMEADDFYTSELVQVKAPTMYKGRFVMVGDAGYCPGPTGGGTSLAMAGAYVLAGEVHRHKGDLAAGLKAYEERMAPIVKDLQAIPPGIPNIMAPQTAWRIWLRNKIFTVIAFLARTRIVEWAGGYFGASFAKDKYGIPDYDFRA